MEQLQDMAGPREIILTGYSFEEQNALDWVTASPTVKKLTLRTCDIRYGEFWIHDYITTKELFSIVDLRKSRIETLDLDNRFDDGTQLPPTLALLALIPSLNALTATARSFRSIGQLPTTLDLPPLRSLVIESDVTGSINQAHIISFLRRCPALELLRISGTIFSRALGPEEFPTEMPNLKGYEGRLEYLTLIRAPALRRVVVKSLAWNRGAVACILTSMPSAVESVALELTAKIDGPATDSIKLCLPSPQLMFFILLKLPHFVVLEMGRGGFFERERTMAGLSAIFAHPSNCPSGGMDLLGQSRENKLGRDVY
ncbi:hypothetical protein FRC01_000917 [Tulasnella sp. 417]|nr:hypothetical protein FRC01_000917 [Tulasnella sp. 417]